MPESEAGLFTHHGLSLAQPLRIVENLFTTHAASLDDAAVHGSLTGGAPLLRVREAAEGKVAARN